MPVLSLINQAVSGRLGRRAIVFLQYLYYMTLQRIHPSLSLEQPAASFAAAGAWPEGDRTDRIELHLRTDSDARGEFAIANEKRRAFATNIPNKMKTENCFVCDGPLMPVLQIVNAAKDNDFFERGWCPQCDHLQYSQMPSKDWFTQWYASHWDTDTPLEHKLGTRHPTARYLRRLAPFVGERKLKILDIGAGYGEKTVMFREAGHELHCTEATAARANYLRDNVTKHVYFGTLDDPAVRDQLKKNGPFDLLFTYHVIEHIYNPRQELQLLREISADDAIFYLAIPELYKEGVFQYLYTLEHIASFSRMSAETLLRQIGFEPVVAKDDPFQYYSDYCQYLIGRKSASVVGGPPISRVPLGRMPDFLRRSLLLDRFASKVDHSVTYRYQGRHPLTYQMSDQSAEKCRDVARHLPLRIYHHGLPLFWIY